MSTERTNIKRQLDPDLKKTIQKRNYRLAKFWQDLGLDIEIVGDIEMPAIIKDDYCLAPDDFYKQTLYGYAYTAIKAAWTAAGYTVTDIHETGQPYPNTFIYDASGFNFAGFNHLGWDSDGYGEDGFNASGYDREKYDRNGYNAAGYNRGGFKPDGFNIDGYDVMGFNAAGYNKDGYDRLGYNAAGYNREGYDKNGFDKDGYDAQGYNAAGVNAAGESRPQLPDPV